MATKKVRVIRLAHVTYQHPDLAKALSFLADFGFVEEHRTLNKVYLRGYGIQPFLYVAEQSPDSKRHFIGGSWVVDRLEDLETAASKPGATPIQDSDAPGGGKTVTLTDPNGFKIEFVYGQKLREDTSKIHLEQKSDQLPSNTTVQRPRRGVFRRFKQGASPVHKLGHYGFVVPGSKWDSTTSWYLDLINLKPTDAVFNPQTGKDETIFNHIDLGQEYTDHHVSSNWGCLDFVMLTHGLEPILRLRT
jgi:catechol 2,3-dioxygenase-like lactoylglutathione lyase family enzyme